MEMHSAANQRVIAERSGASKPWNRDGATLDVADISADREIAPLVSSAARTRLQAWTEPISRRKPAPAPDCPAQFGNTDVHAARFTP
jgi:hypothetical protein